MRIGIFGDIHGDWASMQRVLAALEAAGPDRLVCTGDLVVHGPDSEACVDYMRRHPEIVCVKGNHDHGASVPDDEVEGLHFFSRAGYRHTMEAREALSPENRAYLQALPDRLEVEGATVTHATLRSKFELLNNRFTIETLFADMETPWLFAGHSHRSVVHRLEVSRVASFRPLLTGRPVRLNPAVPTIINVGNTAQLLYDRFPPVYVLWDTEERVVEFREVDLD